MADTPQYRGRSKAIHITGTTPSVDADWPAHTAPVYRGRSEAIRVRADSPSLDLRTITGPARAEPQYRGRSQAIHVFGDAVLPTPPPPVPSCQCCAEGICNCGIADAFGRVIAIGLGVADCGLTYTYSGPNTNWSVDGAKAVLVQASGSSAGLLTFVGQAPVFGEVTGQVVSSGADSSADKLFFGMDTTPGFEFAEVDFATDGTVTLSTGAGSATATLGFTARTLCKLKLDTDGTNARCKVWPASDPEPGSWTLTVAFATSVPSYDIDLFYGAAGAMTASFDELNVDGLDSCETVDSGVVGTPSRQRKLYTPATSDILNGFGSPAPPSVASSVIDNVMADGRGAERTMNLTFPPGMQAAHLVIEVTLNLASTTSVTHPACFTSSPFRWELRRPGWGAGFVPTYDDFQLDPSGMLLASGLYTPEVATCYPAPPGGLDTAPVVFTYEGEFVADVNGQVQIQLRIADLNADYAYNYNNSFNGNGAGTHETEEGYLYTHSDFTATVVATRYYNCPPGATGGAIVGDCVDTPSSGCTPTGDPVEDLPDVDRLWNITKTNSAAFGIILPYQKSPGSMNGISSADFVSAGYFVNTTPGPVSGDHKNLSEFEGRSFVQHVAPAGATHARLRTNVVCISFDNASASGADSSALVKYRWNIWHGTWDVALGGSTVGGAVNPLYDPAWDAVDTIIASGLVTPTGKDSYPNPIQFVPVDVVIPVDPDGKLRFAFGLSDENTKVNVFVQGGSGGVDASFIVDRVPNMDPSEFDNPTADLDIVQYEESLFLVKTATPGVDYLTLAADRYSLEWLLGDDCSAGGCVDCEDPATPGQQLLPFTPGFLPTFRRQIGDPTTSLDSHICTMECGAMGLEWETRGAVSVWGGELIPWSGRTEASIAATGSNLNDVAQAWLHWGRLLTVRSGQTWSAVMAALGEGRAVLLQGDYDQFSSGEKCQAGFQGNHCIILLPSIVSDRILTGDPLCSTWHGRLETSLQAYAEDFGAQVFGVTSPQKIMFAVSSPWIV